MIQCQICQVTNDESAQFCRECGGRLQAAPPLPMPSSQSFGEQEPAAPEPVKKPRLRSPILGGGDDMDDDEPPSPSIKRVKSGQTGPNPGVPSQSGTGGQRRGGLRSPLLGGDDEMDEDEMPARQKGGFGGFPGGKPKKTEFPHRQHDDSDHEGGHGIQGSTGGQKATGGRGGLRSPLLGGGGGGDDDYEDDTPRGGNRPARAPQKSSGKLRSPILGGGGGDDDYYEDEVFEEEQEINDPTVLRSPLLAVRTPRAHPHQSQNAMAAQPTPQTPKPAPPAPQAPPSPPAPGPDTRPAAPFVQGPYSQATTGNAPNFAMSGGPGQSAPAMAMVQPEAAYRGGPNYQPFPPNSSAQATIVAPQAPTQQPAYSPPPAPPAPPGFNQNRDQADSAPAAVAPGAGPGPGSGPGSGPGPGYGQGSGQGSLGSIPGPGPTPGPSPAQDQYNFGLGSAESPMQMAPPAAPSAPPIAQSAPPQPAVQSGPGPMSSPGYQAPLPPAPSPTQTKPNQPALPPNPSSVPASVPKTLAEIPTPSAPKPGSAKATGTRIDSARATGTKMDPAISDDDEAQKPRGLRGSKLLGDVTDEPIGPMDRRSRFNDRRSAPRGSDRRGASSAVHDDEDDHDREPVSTLRGGSHPMSASGSAPNPMSILVVITGVIALIAKVAYIISFTPEQLKANIHATANEGASLLLILALILFAVKANSR